MSIAAELVYEDHAQLEEYAELEEQVLEELLQEAEVAALEQELSEQDSSLPDAESESNDSDQSVSEESESNSHEDSSLLGFSETEVDLETTDGSSDEIIEIVEEDILEDSSELEDISTTEAVDESDLVVITPEELELVDATQELLEEQSTTSLVEPEIQTPEEIGEETIEVEEFTDQVDFVDIEEDESQIDPDGEEVEQYDDYLELVEVESTDNEIMDVEEVEDLQTIESGDIVEGQDLGVEEIDEENHIDLGEEQQEVKGLECSYLDDQLEEFADSASALVEHPEEVSIPDDVDVVEQECLQVSEEYQSAFTPQEHFQAQFLADLTIFETIQAKLESHISSITVVDNDEVQTPFPSTVSFNEKLLPSISLYDSDQEISSLEDELARIDCPRAFQQFHEQLQESQLQQLIIDPQLSVENLADDLKLVSQRAPLPEPPPYDFLADLESYEEFEVEARMQELKNPFYPYQRLREESKTQSPSFIKKISLKLNKISGEVRLPQKFREVILKNKFPQYKSGDYWQVKMTNLNNGISGFHIFKVTKRFFVTEISSRFLDYKEGNLIKWEFQNHFPQSQKGYISLPITVIARFTQQKRSGMINVYIPKNIKDLIGISPKLECIKTSNSPNKDFFLYKDIFIKWSARGGEGVSMLYKNKTFGIKASDLGLKSISRALYDQFTIIKAPLSSNEVIEYSDQVRADFVKNELVPLQSITGISFRGNPFKEKELLLKFVINELIKQEKFGNVKRSSLYQPTNLSNGMIIPNNDYKPDGILKMKDQEKEVFLELKANKDRGYLDANDTIDQIGRYLSLGHPVRLVTTLNRKDIPKSIQKMPIEIISYEDLSKMIDGNSLLKGIIEIIRKSWP